MVLYVSFLFLPLFSDASVVGKTMGKSVTRGLVGHWTFDGSDIVGGSVQDKSGQGNNGNLLNVATSSFYTLGKVGQSAGFDGVNDCASFGQPTALNITGAVSVAAWVRPSSSLLNRQIAGKSTPGGGAVNQQYVLYDIGSNRLRFAVSNGISPLTADATSNSSPNNVWTHVVGTFDGVDTVKIYLNGSEINSNTSAAYGALQDSGRNFMIGGTHGGSVCSSGYFDGKIDDVRVYNRALTAAEIAKLASSTVKTQVSPSRSVTGLVGYWTFDGKDMTNGRVNDLSGNGKTGYLNGTATTTVYSAGKIGQALNLDGSNDSVDITGFTGLNGSTQATIVVWVKSPQRKAILSQWNSHRLFDLNFSGTSFAMAWRYGGSGATGSTLSHVCPTESWAVNVWTQVVFIYNNGVSECWVDGIYRNSVGGGGTLNSAVTETLRIGWNNAPSFFSGKIDDVRIYNVALSTSTIQQLYNQGVGSEAHVTRTDRLTSGLIGYWTFDGKDMPSGRANDVSGNGNTMTLASISTTTFYAPGKIGQGLNFDGANDRVFASSNIVGTGATTLSAWIFPKSFGESSVGEIFSSGLTRLRVLNTNSKFSFSSNNFTNQADSANNSVQLNKWTHIVVTRAADGTANFYVNGVLNGTADQNSGTPGASGNPTEIGNNLTAAVTFDGIIDEARIYNRILSTTEIQQLYNMTK
jgi:hypothetical protein